MAKKDLPIFSFQKRVKAGNAKFAVAVLVLTFAASLWTVRTLDRTQKGLKHRTHTSSRLNCVGKVRYGDNYGGWTMCQPTDGSAFHGAIVYTVGIGRNIKWDEKMIEQFSTIHHGWDPTPTASDYFSHRSIPKGFHFHPYGLGTKDGPVTLKLPQGNNDSYTVMEYSRKAKPGTIVNVDMLSLPSMMSMAGHTRLAVLKIDIEGAEFEVIQNWHAEAFNIPADQLLIEFHERYFRHDVLSVAKVPLAIEQLSDLGFNLTHKTKMEYSFARAELVDKHIS